MSPSPHAEGGSLVAHAHARTLLAVLLALALGAGQAFQWTPFEFLPGDQGYTLEVRTREGVSHVDVDIVARGDAYDVTTAVRFEQAGVAPGDLLSAVFGGSGLSLFAFGPMMLYGPSFFLLPMLFGQEEIEVQDGPIRVLGMGTMYMEREEEVVGHRFVVVRLELQGGEEVEFAVAEQLPFPCFSRYGSGRDAIEVRLVDVR
jgi:hypothetical protein